MKPAAKRLDYLDMAKGLGIFMVTYGHITELGNPVDQWMALFKIAVFYIVAGYLLAMTGKWKTLTIGTHIKKLMVSLGTPYLFFSFFMIMSRVFTKTLNHKPTADFIRESLYQTVTLRGVSTMWFLPNLLLAQIIFFLILKSRNKILFGSMLVLPVPFSLWIQALLDGWKKVMEADEFLRVSCPVLTVSKAIVAVWFLAVGYLSFSLLKKLESPGVRLALGVALSAVTVWMSIFPYKIDFNSMRVGDNPVFFYLGGVAGSLGCMLIFEFLERFHPVILRPFTYFGRNSLILMSAQRAFLIINFCIAAWIGVVTKLPKKVCPMYYFHTLMIFLMVLLMTYGVTELINNYFPFMVGKKYPPKPEKNSSVS